VADHGRLELASPWARQAFTGEDRAVTEALIPADIRIVVTVSADHRRYHFSAYRGHELVLRWNDRYSPVYAAGLMAQQLAAGTAVPA
jgi:hypothetical protein